MRLQQMVTQFRRSGLSLSFLNVSGNLFFSTSLQEKPKFKKFYFFFFLIKIILKNTF
jgi:hypothetical protein